MDPDPSIARGWSSVADAATWAGLSETCRRRFFAYFGITAEDHPRVVAITSSEEFATVLSRCSADGEKSTLTPAEVNKLRLFARACRAACGAVKTSSEPAPPPASAKKKRKRLEEEPEPESKKPASTKKKRKHLEEEPEPESKKTPQQDRRKIQLPESVSSGSRAAFENAASSSSSGNSTRCIGIVESWSSERNCGFLRCHFVAGEAHTSLFFRLAEFAEASPGTTFAKGNRIEFTLGHDKRGPCATKCVNIHTIDQRTVSLSRQVDLKAMHAVELFEVSSGSQIGDEAERHRREGALLQNSANVAEDGSLSGAASIYVAATREFAEQQLCLEVLRANLASHLCKKDERSDAELSSNIVSSYGVALRELLAITGPLNAASLRSAHSNLAGLRNGSAGEWRSGGVRAGLSSFPNASEVPSLVDQFCRNLVVAMANDQASAAAKAAWALYWFTAIHPFGDGNGRLGCIIANWVLRQCSIPFACHFCTSAARRQEFVAALKEGHASAGMDLSRITSVVASAVVATFQELQHTVQRHRNAAATSLADTAVRRWRADRCAETCLVCLDDNPNMATLCCGQPLHFHCFHRALASGTVSRCPGCRKDLPRQDLRAVGVAPSEDARLNDLASFSEILARVVTNDSGETEATSDSSGSDTEPSSDVADTVTDSGDSEPSVDSDTLPISNGGDTEDTTPSLDGADTEPTSDNDHTVPTSDGGDTVPTLDADDTMPSSDGADTEPTSDDEHTTVPTSSGGDTEPTPEPTPGGDTEPTPVGDDDTVPSSGDTETE